VKILVVAGTRPEFIKLYPVYKLLRQKQQQLLSGYKNLRVKFVETNQHQEMTADLKAFWKFKPQLSLDLKPTLDYSNNSQLAALSAALKLALDKLFQLEKPDLVIVQGDTTSAKEAAEAAFILGIKIAHIEAGIRTYDLLKPFPEEYNRLTITKIANLHFAPSRAAYKNLQSELKAFKTPLLNSAKTTEYRAPIKIFFTGNTVIDSLLACQKQINNPEYDWGDFLFAERIVFEHEHEKASHIKFNLISHLRRQEKKIILVTCHRRENLGKVQANLAEFIEKVMFDEHYAEYEFIIVLHKNEQARAGFKDLLPLAINNHQSKIKFLEPLCYPQMVALMQASHLIITDSGGMLEEAPYLKKPTLVLRDKTERMEVIKANFATYFAFNSDKMLEIFNYIHNNIHELAKFKNKSFSAYGHGEASKKITKKVLEYLYPEAKNKLLKTALKTVLK
jgi:UDP-N-acetylglucosamine 2-epimerase (non-hydrolysing)